ncbi:MAG: hypothetical protein SWE60_26150, partial [Thermodesulfobacteriota bacterium]|nr:hypothetical protein [Thermodesulfobacteriota bacterium]
RVLSNLDTEKDHLIQMILVGQPELKSKLQQRQLKQFVQRVTVHCHLRGLHQEEAGQYVSHRLHVAGAENGGIFDKEAMDAVYAYSRGIPRMINILCDSALLYGYADDLKIIGREAIEEVVKERRGEGFFLDPKADGQQSQAAFPSEAADGNPWDIRFQALERRINLLAKAVVHMNRTLSALANQIGKRDRVNIELLKMLQENMKRRKALLFRYRQLKAQGRIKRGAGQKG